MGYYTKYEMITVTDKANAIGDWGFNIYNQENKITEAALVKELAEIGDFYYNEEYVKTFSDLFCDTIKWYEHEKDMLELSNRYPELYFRLGGWGEEREDMWEKVFHNGKVWYQEVEIMYPVWDETDLED